MAEIMAPQDNAQFEKVMNRNGLVRNDSSLEEKGEKDAGEKQDGVTITDVEARKAGLAKGGKEGEVRRDLKARHIQMIAIGGTIGTGLFVGSGAALATGGPIGILLAYLIIGSAVYAMMVALGEMTALFPVSGAWVHYATRFVDPALGFAVGWNYWYSYAITLPTEITAAAIVIQYWDQSTNIAVYISVFIVVILSFNFFGVKYYGEAEFWFSLIKVIAIIGLIILGIVLFFGGGPNHDRLGFRYWIAPGDSFVPTDEIPAPWGPFNQLNGIGGAEGRFLAFWASFTNAAFSFLGTEIVALAAGEAANPRRNVPKAIRRVFWRILLFYVGGVLVIGLTVPYTDSRLLDNTNDAASSPFVIAISNAGIAVLPSIVNAVILISAFSAGNSDLFASSRTLYGLALDHKAPRFFRYCTKNGLPIWCLIATALISALAYLNVNNGTTTVFNWFVNLSTITGLLTWITILIAYIRFHKAVKRQGVDRSAFPYLAPFQPWFSYYGLFIITVVTFFNGFTVFLDGNFTASGFLTAYITIPIFILFYLGWKIVKRTSIIPIMDIDLIAGRRELDEMDASEQAKYVKPVTWYGRFWQKLM